MEEREDVSVSGRISLVWSKAGRKGKMREDEMRPWRLEKNEAEEDSV